MAQYEAKFTELSRFAPQLIAIEEEKALKFQVGLKPYLKNKISILKLGDYLEMVSESIPDPDVGVCFVWPRNPMGHNEDVVSA